MPRQAYVESAPPLARQKRARGSGFVFFTVIVVTEVAGLALGLLLIGAHVIKRVGVEHGPDRVVPTEIGVLGEDRAHFCSRFLGTLIVLSSIVAIKSSNSSRSSSLRWKAR